MKAIYYKPSVEIPDYKIPDFKLPEDFPIPSDYKIPQNFNMQNMMAFFMNLMKNYEDPKLMEQELSKIMSKIIMYDQDKSNYEVPDYKVPGYKVPGYSGPDYKVPGYEVPGYQVPGYKIPEYKISGSKSLVSDYKLPEGLNIPEYKLPEGLNILDYKPTLSLDKIPQTLYVQSLMAIFMNMMSQYQYTVPMIQKISKEMPSSSDAGYQPSMEDIQNILQFIPGLEIPEDLTIQNVVSNFVIAIKNFNGPYPEMSNTFTKNGMLDYFTVLVNNYKPQEFPTINSYMVNKMPFKDVMQMMMGFLSYSKIPTDTADMRITNYLLNNTAYFMNTYKSPGMPALTGQIFGQMQLQLIMDQMFNIYRTFNTPDMNTRMNGEESLDFSKLFAKFNMPFGNMLEVVMGAMSNFKSKMFSSKLEALDINQRVEYFKDMGNVQDFVSLNFKPESINLFLSKIDPELLRNLVDYPQAMNLASSIISILKNEY